MSAEKFARRMEKINKMGLPVLSLEDALVSRRDKTLPRYPVVITIDDGWFGTQLHMVPELEKFQYPATLYVTTYYCEKQHPVVNVALQYLVSTTVKPRLSLGEIGLIGDVTFDLLDRSQRDVLVEKLQSYVESLQSATDRQSFLFKVATKLGFDYSAICSEKWFHLVSFEQISEMSKKGIDIQLHTHRHRIAIDSAYCIEKEITENRLHLESLADKKLRHFCYPSGIYDEEIWPNLRTLNIASATTTKGGLVTSQSHIYSLPRILDGEQVSDIEFEAELSGFNEILRRFFGLLETRKRLM
jgi:peptidoglycan/xylan/chitin deacetylase (PgdA/CDA1 family)